MDADGNGLERYRGIAPNGANLFIEITLLQR